MEKINPMLNSGNIELSVEPFLQLGRDGKGVF
jgi:hypothetical protein